MSTTCCERCRGGWTIDSLGTTWTCTNEQCECHQSKSFVIVPSGRLDYCCECDAEHGYDCPKDKPQTFVEEMRGRFDALFPDPLMQIRTHDGTESGVKVNFDVRNMLKDILEAELRAFGERVVPSDNSSTITRVPGNKWNDGFADGWNAAIAAMRENIERELGISSNRE